jgi:uncharacterized membrane protein YidH (DUF202 family)
MPSPVAQFIASVQRQILEPLVTLIAIAAFLVFIWGVIEFIRGADNDEKRKTGQLHMIWGIIGLVIIFGANSIIRLISATIGVP